MRRQAGLILILASALLAVQPAQARISSAEVQMTATVDAEYERSVALLQKMVNQNSGSMNFAGVDLPKIRADTRSSPGACRRLPPVRHSRAFPCKSDRRVAGGDTARLAIAAMAWLPCPRPSRGRRFSPLG